MDSAAKDADTLKAYKAAFEEAGCDEIVCFPASSDWIGLDPKGRLSDAARPSAGGSGAVAAAGRLARTWWA